MYHYPILAAIWGFLGVFFFLFSLSRLLDFGERGPSIAIMCLSACVAVVSAFWLWRGILWARIVVGLISVGCALFFALLVGVEGASFGRVESSLALAASGICLVGLYTLYVVFNQKRPR